MEMTAAFATFANQGLRMKPFLIERITDREGNVIEQTLPRATDALRADTAFILTSLLRGVVERGTAARARRLRRPIAGKTGTTNDFTDAWFVGYEPSLAAGVWVGFDEKKDSLGPRRGRRRASRCPIWMEFWAAVMADRPVEEFPIPGNIVFVPVDEWAARAPRARPACTWSRSWPAPSRASRSSHRSPPLPLRLPRARRPSPGSADRAIVRIAGQARAEGDAPGLAVREPLAVDRVLAGDVRGERELAAVGRVDGVVVERRPDDEHALLAAREVVLDESRHLRRGRRRLT